ncbi:MAG: hypothetical protein ABIG39_05905 [Candidatus Micrarchaeota archaeon]
MAKIKKFGPKKKRPKRATKSRSKGKKIDLKVVPTVVDNLGLVVAPPALPMRHNHSPKPVGVAHPEVRLVIKTRYMEQRPHVLLIESVLLSSIIVLFFGILLFELHIDVSLLLPVLLPISVGLVVLFYKLFED